MNIDVEERVRIAQEYFKEGYNCSQAVVLAFQDILGVEKDVLERLSAGFGGGVGRMREVCGTVSALAFVSGTLATGVANDHQQQKAQTYAVVQQLAGKFREQNGSIVCRDLLGLRIAEKQSPVPQERTEAYYKARPCVELVGCSARILAEYLNEKSIG